MQTAQRNLKAQQNFKQLTCVLKLTDHKGVLRCKGRLTNADLDPDAKNLILPKGNYFTKLIVTECHETVMHSGLRATLAELR